MKINKLAHIGDFLGSLVDLLGCLAQMPGIPQMCGLISSVDFKLTSAL